MTVALLLILARFATVVAWGAVLAFMAVGAWCAVRGQSMRRGDPMRLACAATAIIIIGYQVRWLLAPDSDLGLFLLHAASASDAVFILRLAHAYGRGPVL